MAAYPPGPVHDTPMIHRRYVVLAAVTLASGLHMGGCGDDLRRPIVAADSAGIAIREYSSLFHPELPSVPVFEEIRTEWTDEGPPIIGRVASGALLGNGGFAVLDSHGSRIVFLSPAGEFLRYAAQAGEGPGDLSAIVMGVIGRSGSVLVPDPGNRAILEIATGSFEASVHPLNVPGRSNSWKGVPGDRLAFLRPRDSGDMLLSLDATATESDTLLVLPHIRQEPTSDDPRWPIVADAWRWDVLRASEASVVAVGRLTAPEVRLYCRGELTRIVRWTDAGAELTAPQSSALYELAARSMGVETVTDAVRAQVRPLTRNLSIAGVWWIGSGLLLHFPRDVEDFTEEVMSTLRSRGFGGDSFVLLDSEGALVGRGRFPRDLDILDVSGEMILGVSEDSLGIEQLSVLRVGGRTPPVAECPS